MYDDLQEAPPAAVPVVVVFGPPLPGRATLALAIERHLGPALRVRAGRRFPARRVRELVRRGIVPVVEGDFTTAADRRRVLDTIETIGGRPLFVAWSAAPEDARRDVYRRYARLPRRFADAWWQRWREDEARREPPGDEVPPDALVDVRDADGVPAQVGRVAGAAGLAVQAPLDHRRRVLVVDDDDENREIVSQILETLGCTVARAGSAEAALDLLAGDGVGVPLEVDLVVSDQQMPGASGTELAATIAELRPGVPVVLLTGYADETVDAALSTTGVALLLAKPVSGADLVRALDELAERREAE